MIDRNIMATLADEQRRTQLIDTYVPTAAFEHLGRVALKIVVLEHNLDNTRMMDAQNKVGPGAVAEEAKRLGAAQQEMRDMITNMVQGALNAELRDQEHAKAREAMKAQGPTEALSPNSDSSTIGTGQGSMAGSGAGSHATNKAGE